MTSINPEKEGRLSGIEPPSEEELERRAAEQYPWWEDGLYPLPISDEEKERLENEQSGD